MNKKRTKARPRGSGVGQDLISAFKEELAAMRRGEPQNARVIEIPDEPGHYSADEVRALRDQLGASQRIFAHLVGVSTILIHSWERGKRTPSPLARRLLDEIAANPSRWAVTARKLSA
jgi:putative transcriptional regulator